MDVCFVVVDFLGKSDFIQNNFYILIFGVLLG